MKSVGKEVKGMFGERINDEREGGRFVFEPKMQNKLYSLTSYNKVRFTVRSSRVYDISVSELKQHCSNIIYPYGAFHFLFFGASRQHKSQADAIKVIKSPSPSVLEVAVKKAPENLLTEMEVKTQLKDMFI